MTKEKYSCVVLKLDLNQTVLKIKERWVPSGLGVKKKGVKITGKFLLNMLFPAVSQTILHEKISEYLSNTQ